MSDADDMAKRRAARANRPIVKTTLAEQDDSGDLRGITTMEQWLALM